MLILGADPGLTKQNPTGLCILNWNRGAPFVVWHDAVWNARDPIAYLIAYLENVPEFACSRLDGVAVEVPHFVKNFQTMARLSEVVGVLISFAIRHDAPLLRCQPSQAKAALTGHGDADKAAMISAARQQFGADLVKDAADAAGVALWACGEFARAQREAA